MFRISKAKGRVFHLKNQKLNENGEGRRYESSSET